MYFVFLFNICALPCLCIEEISRQLIDSDARLIITSVRGYAVMKEATELARKPIKIICIKMANDDEVPPGAISFDEMIDTSGINFGSLNREISRSDDIAFLPYSSGTTGLPKGVELTHTNIIANSEMLSINTGLEPIILPTTDSYQDVLPCVLPFFHIYGLTVTMFSKLNLGCKLVSLPRFLPETFLNALDQHKGNVLHLVPPISMYKK